MRRSIVSALFGVLVALAIAPVAPVNAGGSPADGTDQYYVKFTGQLPRDLAARIAALGGTVVDVVPELNVAIVGGLTPEAAGALGRQPGVADIAEDPLLTAPVPLARGQIRTASIAPASAADPSAAILYPFQWHLRVTGADRAWQAGHLGSPDVLVSMIDSGMDPSHPDLVGRIDFSRSVSYCHEEEPIIAAQLPGYPPWTDLLGHGTWTGSVVSSNANFVAGVTSHTTLMAVKALSLVPCRSSSLFRALVYSANVGADVINMSLGVRNPLAKDGTQGFHNFYKLAVQYALVVHASAVVVSAGNFSLDLDHDGNLFSILCDVPGVICVSATGPTDSGPDFTGPFPNIDAPAFYTNYGSSAIDVAAPGGNGSFDAQGNLAGLGVVWGACASTDREIVGGVFVPGVCSSGGYTALGGLGTSASAPMVSGLAALLVQQLGHQQKGQVQAAIENTADDRGKPGQDPFYGKGRINIARALGVQ